MKKKLLLLIITSLLAINLIGCGEEKIINKSIITEAKITGFDNHSEYRSSYDTLVTDKGEFYFYSDEGINMEEQIKDIYDLNKSLDKDVFVDIVYYNNDSKESSIYKIKDIVIVK